MGLPRYRVRPLPLLLAAAVALLTTVQCLTLFASAASRIPILASARAAAFIHTREEVGDRGIDVSADAHRECAPVPVEALATAAPSLDCVDDVEVDLSSPRRWLHRRISPTSPDDAFYLA